MVHVPGTKYGYGRFLFGASESFMIKRSRTQYLSLATFIGRCFSQSACPAHGTEAREAFEAQLRALFDAHKTKGGKLAYPIKTVATVVSRRSMHE